MELKGMHSTCFSPLVHKSITIAIFEWKDIDEIRAGHGITQEMVLALIIKDQEEDFTLKYVRLLLSMSTLGVSEFTGTSK